MVTEPETSVGLTTCQLVAVSVVALSESLNSRLPLLWPLGKVNWPMPARSVVASCVLMPPEVSW